MSRRGGNWDLLGQSGDPLPGDEYTVASQASTYANVANELETQIASLRAVAANNGTLAGKYVDGLAQTAGDLADQLSKVQGRFETVAHELNRWEPVLADGRRVTGNLLAQAEHEHQTMLANQPSFTPLPADASAQDVADEQRRSSNYSDAQSNLSGLVCQVNSELNQIRSVAQSVAANINAASHDQVKDSWWQAHVLNWIHEHAKLIDVIVKVLTAVAIVLAVIAFVVATAGIGGAALLTGLAIAGAVASAGVLAGDAASMAAGVNDVGWGTIALDVLSLATFGVGTVASKLGGAALKSATRLAENRAVDEAVAGLGKNVTNALKIASSDNPLKIWALKTMATTANDARAAVTTALEVEPKLLVTLATGDREIAEALAKLKVLQQFPAAAATAEHGLQVARVWGVNGVVDTVHLGYDIVHQLTGSSSGG